MHPSSLSFANLALEVFVGVAPDLYDARLADDAKVAELIAMIDGFGLMNQVEGFPKLQQISIPVIDNHEKGKVCWVNSDNKELEFSTKVACYSSTVWDMIKVNGVIREADVSLYRVVDKIAEKPFRNNIWRILQRLIVSAVIYYIWQERN
ncbi:hypothetical protein Tco_0643477 [Tanacetum coccineum]